VTLTFGTRCGNLIAPPGKLEEAIQERVTELQAQEFDASAECTKLQGRLDEWR